MTLINGMRLTKVMVEHGIGVRASRVVELKRLDEDFSSAEGWFALWPYLWFALEVRISCKWGSNQSKCRPRGNRPFT